MHFSLVCLTIEKAIGNAVKDYRKRLHTCVLANGIHFEHLMLSFIQQIFTVTFNQVSADVTCF